MKKVWVNGTFDVLHLGHLHLISEAAKLGSVRIGIDSDSRVKELKGESRPINSQEERKKFLLSIKGVDSVEIFYSGRDLIHLIHVYKPDYLVIGGDYRSKQILGGHFANEIVFIDRIGDYSTTDIISKIIENGKNTSNR